MILQEICNEVAAVIEGLEYGSIQFSYDKLACAMKVGHPADILGSVISEIFFDVQAGRVPEKEIVENVLKGLKRFKRSFKVKELSKPIKEMEAYLANLEERS